MYTYKVIWEYYMNTKHKEPHLKRDIRAALTWIRL